MRFIVLLIFSLNSFAPLQAQSSEPEVKNEPLKSQIGFSEKSSSNYQEDYEQTLLLMADNNNNPQAKDLQTHFENKCGDSDSTDSLSWENTPKTPSHREQKVLTFTCFAGFDQESGSVFTFVIKEQNKLALSTQHDIKNVSVANESQTLKFVLVEILALGSAEVLSINLASAIFPNELDKRLHAGASSILASLITLLSYHYGKFTLTQSVITGMIGSCVMGGLLELVQPHYTINGHPGDRDIRDFKADTIGCLVGSVVVDLAIKIIKAH